MREVQFQRPMWRLMTSRNYDVIDDFSLRQQIIIKLEVQKFKVFIFAFHIQSCFFAETCAQQIRSSDWLIKKAYTSIYSFRKCTTDRKLWNVDLVSKKCFQLMNDFHDLNILDKLNGKVSNSFSKRSNLERKELNEWGSQLMTSCSKRKG